MPRLLKRQEPPYARREPETYTCDALLVNGVSLGEEHRRRVRELNLARQRADANAAREELRKVYPHVTDSTAQRERSLKSGMRLTIDAGAQEALAARRERARDWNGHDPALGERGEG